MTASSLTSGIDVSAWQSFTASNWVTMYNSGIQFVYVKATEGVSYTSSQFSEQYSDSYAAGMLHGAYTFANPNASSGAAAAAYFVQNGGGWSPDGRTLPPALDIESGSPEGQGECWGMSQSALVSWIQDFSSTMLSLDGRLPAIYSNTSWWSDCTGNTSTFTANPLYLAEWVTDTSNGPYLYPGGWDSYAFWQWSDSGTVPGLSCSATTGQCTSATLTVDQDVFDGSLSTLVNYAQSGTQQAHPIIGAGDITGDGNSDVLGIEPDGTMVDYPGTGSGNIGAGTVISAGWQMYDMVTAVGDMDGTGHPDLIARKPDGTLWFYAGTGTLSDGGYSSAVQIGTGWNIYSDIIGVGDMNGDGHPDIIGVKPDGTLWFYAGTGTMGVNGSSGLSAGMQVNAGWNIFTNVIGVGDVTGDGKPDLLARKPDGSLWLYAGTGQMGTAASGGLAPGVQVSTGWSGYDLMAASGSFDGNFFARDLSGTLTFFHPTTTFGKVDGLQPGYLFNSGWNIYTTVIGPGDISGSGHPGLLGVKRDGTMWYYAGAAGGSLGTATSMGGGWNMFSTIVAAGDLNSDGHPDLIGIKPDGTMWYYAGTGSTSNGGFAPGVELGGGWNIFSSVIAVGDFTGTGHPDLIGIKPDGTMWLYTGTGTVNGMGSGFNKGVLINSGWNIYSSITAVPNLNSDGKVDLIARKPDGTMWVYAGTSTSSYMQPGYQFNSGWNIYSSLVSPGDLAGDGTSDLLAVKPDGSLWLYPGSGVIFNPAADPPLTSLSLGSGWNMY